MICNGSLREVAAVVWSLALFREKPKSKGRNEKKRKILEHYLWTKCPLNSGWAPFGTEESSASWKGRLGPACFMCVFILSKKRRVLYRRGKDDRATTVDPHSHSTPALAALRYAPQTTSRRALPFAFARPGRDTPRRVVIVPVTQLSPR